MASFLAEFPLDSAPAEAHRHGSAELVFIIEGELELTVGEENVVLGKGDSAYFDSSVAHSYRRKGRGRCSVVVVTTE